MKAGVPEKTATLMVGWSSREMLDRYNVVAEEELREAASNINRASRAEVRSSTRHPNRRPSAEHEDSPPVNH